MQYANLGWLGWRCQCVMEGEGRPGKQEESQVAALTQKGNTTNVTRHTCWLGRKLDGVYKRVIFFQSGIKRAQMFYEHRGNTVH